MTTIAYKEGFMACDSCWSDGHDVVTLANKIVRLKSGALLGGAGESDDRKFVELLDKIKTPTTFPTHDVLNAIRQEYSGLWVLPSGRIFIIETSAAVAGDQGAGIYELNGPYGATGSGRPFAMAAMAAGKSARDAVRIACKFDLNSRPPVYVMALQPVKK